MPTARPTSTRSTGGTGAPAAPDGSDRCGQTDRRTWTWSSHDDRSVTRTTRPRGRFRRQDRPTVRGSASGGLDRGPDSDFIQVPQQVGGVLVHAIGPGPLELFLPV